MLKYPGYVPKLTPYRDVIYSLFGNDLTYLGVEFAVKNSIWPNLKYWDMLKYCIFIIKWKKIGEFIDFLMLNVIHPSMGSSCIALSSYWYAAELLMIRYLW